jgi:hypothetical protein
MCVPIRVRELPNVVCHPDQPKRMGINAKGNGRGAFFDFDQCSATDAHAVSKLLLGIAAANARQPQILAKQGKLLFGEVRYFVTHKLHYPA